MEKGFLVLCLLCAPLFLVAQDNYEDSLTWKTSLSLTGVFQEGNVETKIFRAKSTVDVKLKKSLLFKNQNSYVFQEFGGDKADEDFLSLNFLYINADKRVYPFVLGILSTNYRRDIDIRYLTGAGVTLQLLNQKKRWLKFSISSEYEKTEFKSSRFNNADYNDQSSINTFRSTFWLNGSYYLLDDKLILSHENFIQPSLEDVYNYRWQSDISISFPIWKFLNFKIDYRHTFESVVIEGQKQEDRFLTFGFTLKNFN